MSVINTNIASLNAQNNLAKSQGSLTTSLERLSSGLRINSAKDDSAGLAISERLTSQIRGNDQASRNANDGISLAQTAEGALTAISDNLQRMRELSVQAANGSNSASDRASIDNEVQSLAQEIDRVAQNTSFNGNNLLDGSFSAQKFQIGANATANDSISVSISSARTSSLGGSGASFASVTTGTTGLAALASGDLTLNGTTVGASKGGGAGQGAGSASSIAAAINAVSSQSGVTATANNATVTGDSTGITAGTLAAGQFSVNGIEIGEIAGGGDAIGQGANTAAAINLLTAQSGVTATADNLGNVTLTSSQGRDIVLQETAVVTSGSGGTTGDAAAATGLTIGIFGAGNAETTSGTIKLNSTNADGITISGGTPGNAGLAAQTVAPSTVLSVNSIATIDVKTAAGATNALSAIDGALATVNESKASLGVFQNRFASVVSNLSSTTENLTASRSRIQDTDFAKETAALTRGQILQQAGTAMLAQANSLPNGVLSLLR